MKRRSHVDFFLGCSTKIETKSALALYLTAIVLPPFFNSPSFTMSAALEQSSSNNSVDPSHAEKRQIGQYEAGPLRPMVTPREFAFSSLRLFLVQQAKPPSSLLLFSLQTDTQSIPASLDSQYTTGRYVSSRTILVVKQSQTLEIALTFPPSSYSSRTLPPLVSSPSESPPSSTPCTCSTLEVSPTPTS